MVCDSRICGKDKLELVSSDLSFSSLVPIYNTNEVAHMYRTYAMINLKGLMSSTGLYWTVC